MISQTISEKEDRLNDRTDEVCSLLESGVSRVRQTERRVLQKNFRVPLPDAHSCDQCGRRLKTLYPDVLCASCVRSEVKVPRKISEAS
jgi:hypothetical protein